MSDFKYESWIPEDAKHTWEEEIFPRARNLANQYVPSEIVESNKFSKDEKFSIKLENTQSNRNKAALLDIPKLFMKFAMGKAPVELWKHTEDYSGSDLIWSIYSAYTGPFYQQEMMKPKEKVKWESDVYEAAKALRLLTTHSSYTDIPFNRHQYMYNLLINTLTKHDINITNELGSELEQLFNPAPPWQDLNGILHDVQLVAQGKECFDEQGKRDISLNPIALKKPNDEHSHRAYFAKYMTCFFGETTGQPKRSVVQSLIECLFDGIEIRALIRIAPWPPKAEGDR
ncbi:hypothetical protein [Paraglaciecola sp.]|uniref:hypothetical protein n=1 Tax=Paraglaciecola sp. TaxID=1920173 RepID=UPI0032647CC7